MYVKNVQSLSVEWSARIYIYIYNISYTSTCHSINAGSRLLPWFVVVWCCLHDCLRLVTPSTHVAYMICGCLMLLPWLFAEHIRLGWWVILLWHTRFLIMFLNCVRWGEVPRSFCTVVSWCSLALFLGRRRMVKSCSVTFRSRLWVSFVHVLEMPGSLFLHVLGVFCACSQRQTLGLDQCLIQQC